MTRISSSKYYISVHMAGEAAGLRINIGKTKTMVRWLNTDEG